MIAGPLVGRQRPLRLVTDAIDSASSGRGGLVLVTGEAGIGKTTLVEEAIVHAGRTGVLVLSGACWDGEGVPGFWPWIQVVRAYRDAVGPRAWARDRANAGAALASLLGEPGAPVPRATPLAPGDRQTTFLLHDAVARLLAIGAERRPVLVALEDLHWADPPSVRLLQFLVRHKGQARLTLVATYRDDEVALDDHPLRRSLLALAPVATNVTLAGLEAPAVRELMQRSSTAPISEELADEVQRRTGGNPFFVEQTAQLWQASGSTPTVAAGIRDVLERRVARLPSQLASVLATAAVLGPEFDDPALAAVLGQAPGEIAQQLAPAVTARLLRDAGPARHAFVHDLVRDTLLSSLGPAEARRRNAAVFHALRTPAEGMTETAPAVLAHHGWLARPDLGDAELLPHVQAAATAAAARMAYEEAAGHMERVALLIGRSELRTWGPVALELGALQQRAGQLEAARSTLQQLADASEHADKALHAWAVLSLHDLGDPFDDLSHDPACMLDHALDRLRSDPGGGADAALAARLLAARARAETHRLGGDRARAEHLSTEAVAMAQRSGDDATLAFALLARHDALWRPGTAAERAAVADEMVRVARRARDLEIELQGALLRAVALIELADDRGIDELDRYVDAAASSRLPRARYMARSRQATLALLRGELEAAREHIDEAHELGDRLGELDAGSVWVDQRWQLARYLGSHDEIDRLVAHQRASGDPHVVVFEATLALDRGERQQALMHRVELEELGTRWPQWAALMWATFLAELAAASGDEQLLTRVRAALAPHHDEWVVLAGGVLVPGPVRRWAAIVERALGNTDRAVALGSAAVEDTVRMGARPAGVLTRLELAEALLARAGHDDLARATTMLEDVAADARTIGMRAEVERAERQLLDVRRESTHEAPARAAPAGSGVFRRTDDVWTLSYAGRTVRVPNSKGLHDLAVLLGRPGQEVAAVDLLDPAGGAVVAQSRRFGADDVLDATAREAYRRRLRQLEEDIDDALARHRDDRAREAEVEREALIDELRRTTGLGARPRRLGDDTERARKAVTARIRDALKRLDGRHPDLAAHLRDAVTTGASCSYRPAHPVSWEL